MEMTDQEKAWFQKKIKKIKDNLKMYSLFEIVQVSQKEDLDNSQITYRKVLVLRAEKAREVYSIIKKYGWLSPEDIGLDNYLTIMKALSYGNYSILTQIAPYATTAYNNGKLSQEDYNRILDYITMSKTRPEYLPKTFK